MTQPQPRRPKVAALIASRNRPDLVRDAVKNLRETCHTIDLDILTVESGTTPDKLCEHSTISYADENGEFLGKCHGHNIALNLARMRGGYDYYWVLHNDVRFDAPGTLDPAAALISAMKSDDRMAICSPMNVDGHFPQGYPQAGRDWHAVCLCDYLGFMMRADVVESIGFLDPSFKFCWGAIHELAYKLNSAGYFIAYHDKLMMKHLGGSTYGQSGTNTISRDDYQAEAARFAYRIMRERYGENWDELFFEAAAKFGIEYNTFSYHKAYWARAFNEDELLGLSGRLDEAERRCGTDRNAAKSKKVHRKAGQIGFPKRETVDAAAKLHPWFVPVSLGELRVPPGVKTEWRADWLSNRIAARRRVLVDRVVENYDFSGKKVLDLACNCAYWSARYAEHGAASVLGMEGRPKHVAQAQLYWDTNQFLDKGRYEFLLGNIADANDWPAIRERGPFDFTLCAGILYHIANYRDVLKWAAEMTREVMLIDTRVGDEHESMIREPGDLNFNAIDATLDKIVPHLPKLIAAIESLGFDAEVLEADFGAPFGLRNVDDYSTQRRVAIFARRRVPSKPRAERSDSASPAGFAERGAPDDAVKLHLGCGPDKRDGWVNIDANAAFNPDVVATADDLSHFADASVDAIEACHLFEHLTLDEARAALVEWRRVLKVGGQLMLELPNMQACAAMIGKHADPRGYDMGTIGLFGYPPDIARDGVWQVHKWGWTPATLEAELRAAGFDRVVSESVTQTWRHAAKLNRDMRLVATVESNQASTSKTGACVSTPVSR
ncbi:MAG: methyltransferase domain-containing protein [Planctomycetes bacterium]|nr:methyltransferase domain-containing protein [Planctomycetota bacterium]